MEGLEDLDTYNSNTEHDMWMDFTFYKECTLAALGISSKTHKKIKVNHLI